MQPTLSYHSAGIEEWKEQWEAAVEQHLAKKCTLKCLHQPSSLIIIEGGHVAGSQAAASSSSSSGRQQAEPPRAYQLGVAEWYMLLFQVVLPITQGASSLISQLWQEEGKVEAILLKLPKEQRAAGRKLRQQQDKALKKMQEAVGDAKFKAALAARHQQLKARGRPSAAAMAAEAAVAAELDKVAATWMEKPSLVAMEGYLGSRAPKQLVSLKQRDLLTQCVIPPPTLHQGRSLLQQPGMHLWSSPDWKKAHRTVTVKVWCQQVSYSTGRPIGQQQQQELTLKLHRLVYFMRSGIQHVREWQQQGSKEVVHMCGCAACCAPWHLRAETRRQNIGRRLREEKQRGGQRATYSMRHPPDD